MTQQPEFGRRLRALRQKHRMSQRQLAGELVTPSYISLLESGDRVPTLDVVIHLAGTLGVPASELLGHDAPLVVAIGRNDVSALLAETLALSSADEHDYAAAAVTLGRAMEEARKEGHGLRQYDIGVRLQYLLGVTGDRVGRVALLEELVALPGVSTVDELQVVLRTDLAAALRDAGRLAKARITATQTADQIQRTPLMGTAAHAKLLGVLISVLVELRDLNPVEPHLRRLLEIAEEVGGQGLRGRTHWVATVAYTRLGRPDEAREHLRLAHTSLASPTMPLRDWLRFCRTTTSVLLEVGGELDEVRSWLDNAQSTADKMAAPAEQRLVTALRARYELAAGNPAAARELVDSVLADPDGLPQTDLLQLRLTRERAAIELGDTETAVDALRQLAIEHEEAGLLPVAVELWRQVDELRSRHD